MKNWKYEFVSLINLKRKKYKIQFSLQVLLVDLEKYGLIFLKRAVNINVF